MSCWRHDYEHREYVCTCDPLVMADTGRDKCPTPGCNGDPRYASPGRGHSSACCYPKGSTYCEEWDAGPLHGNPATTGTMQMRSQCGYPLPCERHGAAKSGGMIGQMTDPYGKNFGRDR